MTTDQAKKNNKGNVRFMKIAIIVLFVAVIIASGVYILYKTQPNLLGDKASETNKKIQLGTGGDVQSVENYNTKAIDAWNSGDKKKARDAARQGLEEYKKLTIDQSKQIPGSIEVSYNLQMMSEGRSPTE